MFTPRSIQKPSSKLITTSLVTKRFPSRTFTPLTQSQEQERQLIHKPRGFNLAEIAISAPSSIIQRVPAIPAIVWFGKALAATTVDAFIDFAIAAVLGIPLPGVIDHQKFG